MPRKRKPRSIKPWELIHDELAEIFSELRVRKATREHFKMTYMSNGKQLKKHCLRILNLLESMDKELEYGLSSEDRWT